jgi:predicted component of type VI protein secretion system
MIRSQESKLLDLRKELSRLKDSSNLNESLELIISKVNDNISSLKKIEYSENEKNGNNQYNA